MQKILNIASFEAKKFSPSFWFEAKITKSKPSRAHGVSIFIDYCRAAAIWRKVEEKERDTGLITE
jgi:hypothetical protein